MSGWYEIGEVVSVRAFGVIRHMGLATGQGTFISNSARDEGVVEQSAQEFSKGKSIVRHGVPFPGQGAMAIARARSKLGAGWSLGSNCEHFVRWAYGVKEESPQLVLWGGLVSLFGVFAVVRYFRSA